MLLVRSSATARRILPQEFVADDMRAIDAVIRRRLNSDVVLVRQVAEYIVNSGGKRLRPLLVILAAGALDYDEPNRHVLAAVVEFIHTATLLHDDVVDASELRRGQPTANALFGNEASVLVGDFLHSRAFQMMVEVGNMRVMQVMSDATNALAEGEVLQLMNTHDPDVDEQAYLRVIRYKTAKLFEAAARIGAILGGATATQEQALADYGIHIGTAFQLIDDVLDYSGDQSLIGKNIGDDLAEGKPTLPLIHVMRHGNADEVALVRHAIEHGGLETLPEVVAAIKRTGALDYVRAQADKESRLASEALATLSDSRYKDYLLQLASFAVTRDH